MPNLLTETFEGVPGGMNLALPQQELDDSECRYLQDALVDYPGLVRRRGPVRKVTGVASISRKGTGIVMTLNPLGFDKYAVLNGDAVNGFFSVLSDDLTTVAADLAWPHPLPTDPSSAATAYRFVDAKPALLGGLMVGVSSAYDANSPNQGLAFWQGANKANYSPGSVTIARGTTALTAPSGFNANVAPGMWLFANTDEGYTSALIGCVRSVNSDTSITLTAASPYAVTAKAGTFQALRGLAPKIVKGRITTDTTSTQVTGGSTKFISQALNVGTWQLYRHSDMAFIGKVSSVASEISLTLAANAAVACADEAYVALRADADFNIATTGSTQKVGFLNAAYADRQWYGNNGAQYEKTSRLWFSDTSDPEALDLSVFDGDWLDITSSSTVNEPLRALGAAQNGLLVLKENETFIITGSSPSSFTVRKLEDDGTISGMSVQPYGGGLIWAGREGIHFYDGVQVQNLVGAKLGDYWKNTVRTLDPAKYRMWSMVNRDHYMLFLENVQPTVAVVKGNVSHTPTSLTVLINMATGAVVFSTNMHLRGAVVLPATAGKSVWYLVNGQVNGDTTDHAFICDGEALFNEEGVDPIFCDFGTSAVGTNIGGPDFFFESKKFYAGDSLRLKRFKQLAVHYLAQGGSINVDTVLGLNNVGTTLSSSFPASVYTWDTLRAAVSTWDNLKAQFPTWSDIVQGVFVPKRVRFIKRSQHLSFRFWQSTSSMSRVKTGPYQIGYKLQRPGRV